MTSLSIGFIGAGNMATALARGFLRAGLVTRNQLIASDVSAAARAAFAKETGAKTTGSNADVATSAQVLILAVKPDQVNSVLAPGRAAGGKAGGRLAHQGGCVGHGADHSRADVEPSFQPG